MPNMRITSSSTLFPMLLLAVAPLFAMARAPGADATLPEWDQLSAAQREALVAPMRQRWNDHPEKRRHMLSHAERWQEMEPGQRDRARRGAERWRQMDPARREALRALYAHMKTLPEAEREALREQWKSMTPEQRQAWVRAHPAPARPAGGD